MVGWLVGCILRPIDSETAPHSLSLAKDVKLGFLHRSHRESNPARPVAVHTTAAQRQLHFCVHEKNHVMKVICEFPIALDTITEIGVCQ